MISNAFVEVRSKTEAEPEMLGLAAELEHRGLKVSFFTPKDFQRGRLELSKATLVAGQVPTVIGGLKALSVPYERLSSYPDCLQAHFHRSIWSSTLGKVRAAFEDGSVRPLFIKPSHKPKRFAAVVVQSLEDMWSLGAVSRRTRVYCADPVEWVSEHRCFVLEGALIDQRFYSGDVGVCPDDGVVSEAIAAMAAVPDAPVAYCLDVGVLKDGQTAVVEVNDAFGFGAYGLEYGLYADMTLARWAQLVGGVL